MPVIQTQNLVNTLANDNTLKVFATAPGARHDLPCWCRIKGHAILSGHLRQNVFEIVLQPCRE
ncbi:sulfurtransferase TusA family protein [Legionella geestiana]|uniref:sulfurtransferase TusA family protein n=1 Tax=Legionella geestiana TaxID=45065 RepID=UPI00068525B9|nr:sulfurtransferase TusA family protein [Legionella geestiana]QDQ41048.1 sulfurtransferase TusA family protein [Legionella geestiana]